MTPDRERYARLQAAIARHGVGALCLATPHLAAFASGARRVLVAGSGGSVPWVVVLAGAPSAVVFTTDPDGAPPWMPRQAVEPLCWDRARQLARIAALVGATSGAIACDVFSPALREAIGERRPGVLMIDAAPLLAEAATPRSEAEVAAVARALAATRAGLRAAAAGVVPGATPAGLGARFAAATAGTGAGFPLHEGVVRRAGVRLAGGQALRGGDVVQLAFGLWLDGHAGVAGDTVGCGADLSAARRRWAEALCAVADRCRAGAPTRALRAAAAGQTGLLVHGLGVGIEPPLVDLDGDDDGTVLGPGTILVLAPEVDGFRATRALVVTERGRRWLEPAP